MKRWSLVVLLVFGAALAPVSALAAEIAVIVHSRYPQEHISLKTLKEIYLGEKQYEGSTKIIPVDHRDTEPIKKAFLKKVLGLDLGAYKGHWLIRVFRDGNLPPEVMDNRSAVIEAVGRQRGAVGYVWADEVPARAVKVLLVIPVPD